MHEGQWEGDAEAVRPLVDGSFPAWRDRPITAVRSAGTDNALFRVGADAVVRLPLLPDAGAERRSHLERAQWRAARIAPLLPVAVPTPLGLGEPGPGYPGHWSAWSWIEGTVAAPAALGASIAFAGDLAGLVRAFHAIDAEGATWDGASRGGPLATRDGDVRESLALCADLLEVAPITVAWERCLDVGGPPGPDVSIHADLMPGNLLVADGRLAALIDLEGCCVGDPAVDLMPAWNLLAPPARAAFRRGLAVDDATWERGRGWAICQAIVALPYYVETNPSLAATARRTLAAAVG